MKNKPKNRPRTLKTTPTGEPRPQRHRKTRYKKHNNLDEKKADEPTTIKRAVKELKHLERNCNSAKPEEVKLYIANKAVSNARKENLIESYNMAIKSLGLTWNKPFYKRKDKKRES